MKIRSFSFSGFKKQFYCSAFFVVSILFVVACNRNTDIKGTDSITGDNADSVVDSIAYSVLCDSSCYILDNVESDELFAFRGAFYNYSICWPEDSVLQRLVLKGIFSNDELTIQEQCRKFLQLDSELKEEYGSKLKRVNNISERDGTISEISIMTDCFQSERLFHYVVLAYSYPCGAAHGMSYATHIVYDKNLKKKIELTDIVDTKALRPFLLRAYRELQVNEVYADCLFEESYADGKLPIPDDFYIDLKNNSLVAAYQIYSIAPYSCGFIELAMPADWMASVGVPLTSYGRSMFNLDAPLAGID